MPSITGITRSSSSRSDTASAPGRVDSPPTSSRSAPSNASRRPWLTAASRSRKAPPSENESGVTLSTPMMRNTKPRRPPTPARASPAARARAPRRRRRRGRGAGARACPPRGRPRWAAPAAPACRCRVGVSSGPKTSSADLPASSATNSWLSIVSRLSSSSEIFVSASRCSTQHVLGDLVRRLDDAPDLVVDLARDLVGVVGLGGELAAEERLAVVVAEDARAELLATCRSASPSAWRSR